MAWYLVLMYVCVAVFIAAFICDAELRADIQDARSLLENPEQSDAHSINNAREDLERGPIEMLHIRALLLGSVSGIAWSFHCILEPWA